MIPESWAAAQGESMSFAVQALVPPAPTEHHVTCAASTSNACYTGSEDGSVARSAVWGVTSHGIWEPCMSNACSLHQQCHAAAANTNFYRWQCWPLGHADAAAGSASTTDDGGAAATGDLQPSLLMLRHEAPICVLLPGLTVAGEGKVDLVWCQLSLAAALAQVVLLRCTS